MLASVVAISSAFLTGLGLGTGYGGYGSSGYGGAGYPGKVNI